MVYFTNSVYCESETSCAARYLRSSREGRALAASVRCGLSMGAQKKTAKTKPPAGFPSTYQWVKVALLRASHAGAAAGAASSRLGCATTCGGIGQNEAAQ